MIWHTQTAALLRALRDPRTMHSVSFSNALKVWCASATTLAATLSVSFAWDLKKKTPQVSVIELSRWKSKQTEHQREARCRRQRVVSGSYGEQEGLERSGCAAYELSVVVRF